MPETVADVLQPLLDRVFPTGLPVCLELWDGSSIEPVHAQGDACSDGHPGSGGRVVVRSPDALKHLLWAPGELGIARAFVTGTLDLAGMGDGPEAATGRGGAPSSDALVAVLSDLHRAMGSRLPTGPEMILPLLSAARRLRLIGPAPGRPSVEVHLSSRWRPNSKHTKARDAEAIRHHYDIGNEFYELLLGPAMTYSCARFERAEATLEEAQASKHELVCRKLGLGGAGGVGDACARETGAAARLLDIGCGWGGMAMHAAGHHDAEVVGVTLSDPQATLAKKRIAEAGLADRVEIRVEDYRDLRGESFDAVSSIGMFEHVGEKRMMEYFRTVYGLLRPQGRLLNHAISSVGGSKMRGRTFINRYVFPDGELIDVADVVRGMERGGFEVRDVESLREHYAKTLRCWLANLEEHWDEAVEIVGFERARVWRLYMSASVNGFEDGGIAIHQVLGVKTGRDGSSGMPATRAAWG
jgi:cyclopropane-fatty-acyl-phospholipid synthase